MGQTLDRRKPEEIRAEFLEALMIYGNVSRSAKKARISRETIYKWLRADENFKAAHEEAAAIGIGALEDEARRRAYEGTLKPIYQKGVKVGSVREYSDTLLIFLLKGAKPEMYKDRHEHTGAGGGAIKHDHEYNITLNIK